MAFQKKFTAVPVPGGYAVAKYGNPTGQIYDAEKRCNEEIEKIYAEQKARKPKK